MQTSVYHPAVIDYVAQQTHNISVDGGIQQANAAVTQWHSNISNLVNTGYTDADKNQFFQTAALYLGGYPGDEEQKNSLFNASRMLMEMSSGIVNSTPPPPNQINLISYGPNQSSTDGSSTTQQTNTRNVDSGSESTTQGGDGQTQSADDQMDYFGRAKSIVEDVGFASSIGRGVQSVTSSYLSGELSAGVEELATSAGIAVGEEAGLGTALAVASAPEIAVGTVATLGAFGLVEAGYGIYKSLGLPGRSDFLDSANSYVRGFFDHL